MARCSSRGSSTRCVCMQNRNNFTAGIHIAIHCHASLQHRRHPAPPHTCARVTPRTAHRPHPPCPTLQRLHITHARACARTHTHTCARAHTHTHVHITCHSTAHGPPPIAGSSTLHMEAAGCAAHDALRPLGPTPVRPGRCSRHKHPIPRARTRPIRLQQNRKVSNNAPGPLQ